MPAVEVPLGDATDRRLPAVSVRSGRAADGYAPAGRRPTLIRVPLTQSEFDHLMALRRRQKSGLYGAFGFLAAGAAMSRFTLLLSFGVLISVVSVLMWAVATLGAIRLLPAVEVDRHHGTVALGRVHRRFVEAVADAGGR